MLKVSGFKAHHAGHSHKARDPWGAASPGSGPAAQQDPSPHRHPSKRRQGQPRDAAATARCLPRGSAAGGSRRGRGGGQGRADESADPLCGPKCSLKPTACPWAPGKAGGVIKPVAASLSLMKHLPKSMALCWVASANEEKAFYCFSGERLTHHKEGPLPDSEQVSAAFPG